MNNICECVSAVYDDVFGGPGDLVSPMIQCQFCLEQDERFAKQVDEYYLMLDKLSVLGKVTQLRVGKPKHRLPVYYDTSELPF